MCVCVVSGTLLRDGAAWRGGGGVTVGGRADGMGAGMAVGKQ